MLSSVSQLATTALSVHFGKWKRKWWAEGGGNARYCSSLLYDMQALYQGHSYSGAAGCNCPEQQALVGQQTELDTSGQNCENFGMQE